MANMGVPVRLRRPLSERASLETTLVQGQSFTQFSALCQVLDAIPNAIAILNAQRQIIYANHAFSDYVSVAEATAVIGLRVGEAINCLHATDASTGCGTSNFCSTCGALHAILQAQQGKKSVQECRITRSLSNELEAVDLRVWATPFEIEGDLFTIFAAVDIADEKRRHVLERIFFHDIRNTAGVIFGVAELMRNGLPEGQEEEFSKLLFQAAHKLIDEINAQQQLLAAERGELLVKTVPLISLEILHNALALYEKHLVAQQRYLRIDPESELFLLHTDEALLGRVIGNMVKNALEACRPEETVTLGCRIQEGMACFWVHNPAVMSPTVQLQIFNRSFSTKGHDRGLGTYSIKLLSERYLGGAISFTSSEGEGTVFTAIYPLNR